MTMFRLNHISLTCFHVIDKSAFEPVICENNKQLTVHKKDGDAEMSEKDKEEFRNAIRRIGYCSVKLENPYDRVRVSEWIRKLVLMDDDSYDNIKKRNEYIQYLKIQVSHGVIQMPFSKPPPDSDLPTLPEMLGNALCSRIPDLPKTGPISPAIIHKSPDGRAYISIKHVPGDGVLCYMAVTPNPDELQNKEQK